MGLVVDFAEAAAGEVGVDLGGGEAGVAEEFLDGAKVSAGLQQVGGEGVAEGMGADAVLSAGAQHVPMDDAADAAGGEGAAAVVEEKARLAPRAAEKSRVESRAPFAKASGPKGVGGNLTPRFPVIPRRFVIAPSPRAERGMGGKVRAALGEEVRTPLFEVALDRTAGVGTNHHHTFLPTFADDAEFGGGAALVSSEGGEFAHAEAGGVEGLEDGAVAKAERSLLVGRGEELLDVFLVEEARQPAALAGGGDADGRVCIRLAVRAKVAVERSQ
jgi:hypothetical protein